MNPLLPQNPKLKYKNNPMCNAWYSVWSKDFPMFFYLSMFVNRKFASKLAKMEFCVVIVTIFDKVLSPPFPTTKFGKKPLLHAYFHQKKI